MPIAIQPAKSDSLAAVAPRHQLLPEWSPCRAVLLAWPFPGSDWDATLAEVTRCYWDLLKAILASDSDPVEAWVLLHPSMNTDRWRADCIERDMPMARVKVLDSIHYDDTWIRDYGPLSTGRGDASDEYLDFAFNGWGGKYPAEADDDVSAQLAGLLEQMPVRYEWVLEGGALEINGAGVLLANKDCVVDPRRNCGLNEQQVMRLLEENLGVTRVEWVKGICLSGDDTDGHIDTIARFAADDCIVHAGRNPDHPDAAQLEDLCRQVSAIAERNGWRHMELPSPIIHSRVDGRPLPATYANFLIVNQRILAPVYGVPEDAQALAVLRKAFPMHSIVPVECVALVEQHGSLHCATMQVAQQQVRA